MKGIGWYLAFSVFGMLDGMLSNTLNIQSVYTMQQFHSVGIMNPSVLQSPRSHDSVRNISNSIDKTKLYKDVC